MRFTWDPRKARANLREHGVSFDEAITVFGDPDAVLCFDLTHSDDEDRYLQLGVSNKERLLIVCHCYRDDVVRIISARKVTSDEEISYLKGG